MISYNIEEIKSIPISSVAESIGYAFDKTKGHTKFKEYQHEGLGSVVISPSNTGSGEMYFTRNDDTDRGSVIDFVMNRASSFTLPDAGNKFQNVLAYLATFTSMAIASPRIFPPEQPSSILDPNLLIRPAKIEGYELQYLRDRGLTEKTLLDFKNDLYVNEKNDKYPFQNVVFPYADPTDSKSKVKHIEMRNEGFKAFAKGGSKSNSVWVGRPNDTHASMIRQVVWGESAIDLMSLYQLRKSRLPQDIIFIGTGGQISDNQIRLTKAAFPNAQHISAFDRDLQGTLMSIRLAAKLSGIGVTITKPKNTDNVNFDIKGRSFQLPEETLSLALVEKVSGIRSGVSVAKPTHKDWNEDLVRSAPKSAIKR